VEAIGVRPTAKELGTSRTTLRDWERKVAKAAKGEGPTPTSGPDPKTIENKRDAAILTEWRKQAGRPRSATSSGALALRFQYIRSVVWWRRPTIGRPRPNDGNTR